MTTHKHYRGGLPTDIPFALPATWSPEQALAVIELLDDLRERIWRIFPVPFIENSVYPYDFVWQRRLKWHDTCFSVGM